MQLAQLENTTKYHSIISLKHTSIIDCGVQETRVRHQHVCIKLKVETKINFLFELIDIQILDS